MYCTCVWVCIADQTCVAVDICLYSRQELVSFLLISKVQPSTAILTTEPSLTVRYILIIKTLMAVSQLPPRITSSTSNRYNRSHTCRHTKQTHIETLQENQHCWMMELKLLVCFCFVRLMSELVSLTSPGKLWKYGRGAVYLKGM